MIELIAQLLAGLGLYFSGVGGIRTSLQQFSGRKFRDFIARASANPASAAVSGFCMGTVTQTSIGISVILAGLISRRMATVSQALPVVAWSNLGLVTLVFLNNLPIHIVAMTLAGVCGICINFGFGGRFKGWMPSLFSLGLLLLGLRLIKESMHGLSLLPGIAGALSQFNHLPFATLSVFLLGVILRVPIQSSSAVTLIGITMHSAGVFTEDQALMMVYGTALGSGLSVFLLTAHFRGIMRQITLFEAIINGLAGVLVLTLFYLEKITQIPLLLAGAQKLTGNVEMRLACLFLVQQALCVAFAYLLLPRAQQLLERLAPTTVEQDLSRPRFIHDEALMAPATALSLVEQELFGLLKRTPDYLSQLRPEAANAAPVTAALAHSGSQAILRETEHFLAELALHLPSNASLSLSLLHLERHLHLLDEVQNALHAICREMAALPSDDEALCSLRHNVAESLHMLLTTTVEAARGEASELQLLGQLTASPGEVIERLRSRYLGSGAPLSHSQRASILAITTQHERIMLTLNQISRALTPAAFS